MAFTKISDPIAVLTGDNDKKWAVGAPDKSQFLQSYYDYWYSGEDVTVHIEYTEDQDNGGINFPIMQFAYSVEQKKVPLYGHASFTYDGIMRGTRLVTGGFMIPTKTTDALVKILSVVADKRIELNATSQRQHFGNDSTIDEKNKEKYWTLNRDPSLYPSGYKNIFSSHPPFNFIIGLGVQSISAENCVDIPSFYESDPTLILDTNERLIDSDPQGKNKIKIRNVEIVKLDQTFSVGGEILAEMYSFFAQDMYPLS